MQPTEIRLAGLAEQGVILLAKTIAKAVVMSEQKHALMTQDADDGDGSCSVQVIVSEQPACYRYVCHPHILVVMSQQAYSRFSRSLRPGGLMLIEQDLVYVTSVPDGTRIYSVPAKRIAEEVKDSTLQNLVMLGCFGAVAGVLKSKSLRIAVESSTPSTLREQSLQAYDEGHEYGLQILESGPLRVFTFERV